MAHVFKIILLGSSLLCCSESAKSADKVLNAMPPTAKNFAIISVNPVDDHFKCILNDKKVIVDLNFERTDPPKGATVDFFGDLDKGKNILRCTISDEDKGNSFAYSYTLRVQIGNSSMFHEERDYCSGVTDRPCRRQPGDNKTLAIVTEHYFWINNYP